MIFHFFRGQPFLNENQNHGVGTSRSWDPDILQWAVPFALSTGSHPKKTHRFSGNRSIFPAINLDLLWISQPFFDDFPGIFPLFSG